MVKVPEYVSRENLSPTQADPSSGGLFGREVKALGKDLSSIAQSMQKMQDQNQTLKAQTVLAQKHNELLRTVATSPDLDTLDKTIVDTSDKAIQEAADLIKNPEARSEFVSKAQLDVERRNVPLYNMAMRRQSQDYKGNLLKANDQDFTDYRLLKDPTERQLLRQQIVDRTNEAAANGYINPSWAKQYLDTHLKQNDQQQVKDDIATNPQATYEQLQKGKEGLYPDISEAFRKESMNNAQKMIEKQGSDNKIVFAAAQNHEENQIIDKMQKNILTQEDINQGVLNGVLRPEFAQAATEALQDPFPTESNPDKYLKLVDMATDPDMDPLETKINILKTRGLTPAQKSHLINGAMREDAGDGKKKSLEQLITEGVQQNKQAILQAQHQVNQEVEAKRSFVGKIKSMFSDHASDDAHLAQLQQNFMEKVSQQRKTDEMLGIAKEIINKDTLKRNPKIATADPKGTIFMDKTTGAKRRYFPDGHWDPAN